MKQNIMKKTLLVLLGVILIAGGGALRKFAGEIHFSSFLMAAGVLVFGRYAGSLLKDAAVPPELKKQEEIEENDERNQLVRGKAAWRCFSVMQVVLLLTGLALSYMKWTAGVVVLCLSVLQSLVLAGFLSYYQKRM